MGAVMKNSGKHKITAIILGLFFFWLMLSEAHAQNTCSVSFVMINHNRYVYETDEECGPIHSSPWGNWGVSSNVGDQQNTDQFKGWGGPCSNTKVEWNSCSVEYVHPDPDCQRLNFPNWSGTYPYPANGYPYSDSYTWNDLVPPYGTDRCVDQYSPCGVNEYGGAVVDYWVSTPFDLECDGVFERGGCLDLNGSTITVQNNFMTLYELDTLETGDDLVQTLNFPDVSETVSCDLYGCHAVGDNNLDGWIDDVGNQFSPSYKWPILYQDDWGATCYPGDPGVPCKRVDATIRIGRLSGRFIGTPCDPYCDLSCL
jgi:hypothetical protein